MQREALPVVQEEEWAAVLGLVVFRAYAKFISDAVSGAHQFGSALVGELIGL